VSSDDLVIQRAALSAGADVVDALRAFYAEWGTVEPDRDGGFALTFGSGQLAFVPGPGRPFHHYALLVPGGRYAAARDWLAARTPLLTEPGSTETTFDFPDWDALACYAADPAGNIIELLAHAELCPSTRSGPFDPGELCAISELGLVVEDRPAARATLAACGLMEWSAWGGADGLSFIGRKGYTLILASPPRGWLPIGVPAQSCAASVEVALGGSVVSVTVAAGELTAN
jgi:hypothetical protein